MLSGGQAGKVTRRLALLQALFSLCCPTAICVKALAWQAVSSQALVCLLKLFF